jgi:hypothetical protein
MYSYYDWYFLRVAQLALVVGAFAACALLAAFWKERKTRRGSGPKVNHDTPESTQSLLSAS